MRGDVIEIGEVCQPPEIDEEKGKDTARDLTDQFAGEKLGEDIGWVAKIKTKFEDAGNISRQQLYAKKKGDVIHYILSRVLTLPDNGEAFLRQCIRTGIAQYHFFSYEEEIENIIFGFFRNVEFAKFFESHEDDIVFTEKEIIDDKGNTFKIDRMIVHGDSVDVIDFKSGESQTKEHREQIGHYAQLIKKIHPDTPVRTYLLYIEENTIITL
jgi:ATP-dependent exoDNAse (exonuclease V) beta subunit